MREVVYSLRETLDQAELDALFVASWGGSRGDYSGVLARSFTWVTARQGGRLVGFVNVAWDGGVHFFLLDTSVHADARHLGIGTELVRRAVDACRGHGDWVHVDADDALMTYFYGPAGFRPTPAGLAWVGEAQEMGGESSAAPPAGRS